MTSPQPPIPLPPHEGDDEKLTAKQAERRQRILIAVRKLVGELGYAQVSMRDVAAEAQVAHATLYNLYTNKDNLVLAALQDNIGRIVRIREEDYSNALEKYLGIVRAIVQDIIASPRYADAMTQLLFNASPSDEVVTVLIAKRITHDHNSLLDMRDQGLILAGADLAATARQLTGAYWSSMLLWIKGFTALHDVPRETIRAHKLVVSAVATKQGKNVLSHIPD